MTTLRDLMDQRPELIGRHPRVFGTPKQTAFGAIRAGDDRLAQIHEPACGWVRVHYQYANRLAARGHAVTVVGLVRSRRVRLRVRSTWTPPIHFVVRLRPAGTPQDLRRPLDPSAAMSQS